MRPIDCTRTRAPPPRTSSDGGERRRRLRMQQQYTSTHMVTITTSATPPNTRRHNRKFGLEPGQASSMGRQRCGNQVPPPIGAVLPHPRTSDAPQNATGVTHHNPAFGSDGGAGHHRATHVHTRQLRASAGVQHIHLVTRLASQGSKGRV